MILVDTRLTDLVSGYDRVREAALQSKWRPRLLRAYAHRREAYEVERSQHRRKMTNLKPRLATGSVVAAVMFLAGLLLRGSQEWLASLLMLMGVVGGGLLGTIWLWKAIISSPKPPQHPLREPLKSKLFPPLLPPWREGLRGQLPTRAPYEGFTGENDFVESLQRLQGDSSCIIYRLRQRLGDDVDVTVVGPKGVWVFEVKYWSGRTSWHDGGWSHEKSYYQRGGNLVTESLEIGQPPDQQWQRMADDVAETLHRRVPWLSAFPPALIRIKGGLVFTHPDASYDIAPGCPCTWGTIDFWIRRLASAPVIAGMNEYVILHILDALLARHRQVSGNGMTMPMDTYAAQLIQNSEARLEEWTRD